MCLPSRTGVSVIIASTMLWTRPWTQRANVAPPAPAGETPAGTTGRMPALHLGLLDHRHFAVGHAKAQTFSVALRDAPALRDHRGVLASGVDGGGHAGTPQCGLEATSAKPGKRPGAAQGKDSVLGDDQPCSAGRQRAFDTGYECQCLLHPVERRDQSLKSLRSAIGKECSLHDCAGGV